MSEFKIANRYAEALMKQASEAKSYARVAEDMQLVYNTCKGSKDLVNVLKNPVLSGEKKESVLKSIFSQCDITTHNLFTTIITKKREALLLQIAAAFLTAYDKMNGITKAVVTTAVPLDSKTAETIMSFVRERTAAQKVEIENIVNKELVGGFTIRFDDYLVDTSISTQIKKLKKELNIA